MKLPVVSDIKKIQPMFCYFKGDQQYTEGIYCCIIPNVFIKVPFPEIIDSTKEYDRGHSIRCKYKTKKLCDDQRGKMAKYHKSQVRICNFAHNGEEITKIGYPSRCATIPNFGNPSTFANDLKIVDTSDIKNIMFYGVNDLIASAIWFDYTNSNTNSNTAVIFDNLQLA
jgi:hypothetical protein